MSTSSAALYLIQPDHTLVPMEPSAPVNEDELQALLAAHPELLGESAGTLLLVEREKGIPGAQDGNDRWSIDHLFVTRQSVPVLVEVKRAVDTRLRREVVGQLLDYAANGVAYWPTDSLRMRFEKTCMQQQRDADEVLTAFLGGEADPAAFWTHVDDNLRAGRIFMLFVADEIPVELARVVEFMNDQMRAEVRAIELRYFRGPNGSRLIAPHVIGETERTRAEKVATKSHLEPITVDEWLDRNINSKDKPTQQGALALLGIMKEIAPVVAVASTQGSIYALIPGPSGKNSYPIFLTKSGRGQIAFGWLGGSQRFDSTELRQEFYKRFAAAVGPLTNENFLTGFPSFPLARLTDPSTLNAFREVAIAFAIECAK